MKIAKEHCCCCRWFRPSAVAPSSLQTLTVCLVGCKARSGPLKLDSDDRRLLLLGSGMIMLFSSYLPVTGISRKATPTTNQEQQPPRKQQATTMI